MHYIDFSSPLLKTIQNAVGVTKKRSDFLRSIVLAIGRFFITNNPNYYSAALALVECGAVLSDLDAVKTVATQETTDKYRIGKFTTYFCSYLHQC